MDSERLDDTRHDRECATVKVATPSGFSFIHAVYSHGWFDLPPFVWSEERRLLRRVIRLRDGQPVALAIREASVGGLEIDAGAPGSRPARSGRDEVARQVRHMLRLDDPMDGFYALCRGMEGYGWVDTVGAGRLLRAPDPFEDLVKLICTTNCSWSLTRIMIGELVSRLGEKIVVSGRGPGCEPLTLRAFPSPEEMAGRPVSFFRDRVRAGYRSPHLRRLARMVAGGDLTPGSWLDRSKPSEEITAEILSVPGAGRYVAENMLKLLGRYDGLGLDSWCRRKFAEIHGRGRKVTDRSIERHYARFGSWRGLALWCDLTKDWSEGPLSGTEALHSRKY
jgi:N-glycosylase/DNA lyase